MLILGQLFYGVGSSGYGVLGFSPSAERASSAFSTLCQSLRTQTGTAAFDRILLSRRSGQLVLMACCIPGGPDSAGRPTPFFHGLCGSAESLQQAGCDAFCLADRNCFASSFDPAAPIPDLRIAPIAATPESAPFQIRFPAAIPLDRPDEALFRALLGRETLDRSWKTFSFAPDGRDDLVAVPRSLSLPEECYAYDRTGRLLRKPLSLRRAESRNVVDHSLSKPVPVRPQTPTGKTVPLALLGSLILNCVLLVVLAFRNRPPNENPETQLPEQERPPESGQVSLRDSPVQTVSGMTIPETEFPRFGRIASFDEALADTKADWLVNAWTNDTDNLAEVENDAKSFLKRCKDHVDWINGHFPVHGSPRTRNEEGENHNVN